MALGQSNEILISVGETILKVVNNHSSKMSDSLFDAKPYYPTAIHVTSGGKVVVGGLRNDRGGVIVMDQKEEREKVYVLDDHNEPLFRYP